MKLELDVAALTGTAAALAGTLLAVMLGRTIMAGRAKQAPPPADELGEQFLARKHDIAAVLSAALQLQTVSFDRPAGAAVLPTRKPACAGFHDHVHGTACAGSAATPASAPAPASPGGAVDPFAERRAFSEAQFLEMHKLLQRSYPLMHAQLEKTVINKYSLVFVWRGSDPSLQAAALYAHMDVVPADDGDSWTFPPFGGVIRDGYVCGRGAIDDKQGVIGICEAVEHLCRQGFKPRRTTVIMLGHDEEIGGDEGAAHIVAWIEEHLPCPGKRPLAFLLDEGLFVLDGAVPGHADRTALICTAEKGYVNVELKVAVQGGHASQPPRETAIGILSRALSRLEANPFPAHLGARNPARRMLETLLPGTAFPLRLLFANLWATEWLVARVLAASPKSATLVRTTTALTVVRGGNKVNTLPPEATAVVNHRIHPNETVAHVLARDAAVIGDARVQLSTGEATEPSPVSDDRAPAFGLIADAVRGLFPKTAAAPALMVGATDSKWSVTIADNIYRHCPTELHVSETAMFHGKDERISVDNLARIGAFYARVIIEASKRDL